MKDTKIPLGWLIPIIGVILLLGWFLGRLGWNVTEVDGGIVKLAPPTATLSAQPLQPTDQQPAFLPSTTVQSPTTLANENLFAVDVTFVVQANQPWQDTGIELRKGTPFIITYVSGEWTGKSGDGGMSGPDYGPSSANSDACFPIRGEGSSLIGKIGVGSPFKVGYQYIGEAQDSGFLFLRMNDCDSWLFDNKGSITVRIQVRH